MAGRAIQIAPSILAADFSRLGEQVAEAQAAGADMIHIDVMDGSFVPNITMGPLVVEAVAKVATIPLDVHLMIAAPERFLKRFADSGADNLTVHIEACPHLHRTLAAIAELGCRPGVALNPHSPAGALAEVLGIVDLINVMTVNPGFGGQAFITSMTKKIRQLRQSAEAAGKFIDIEVDGGITDATIGAALAAGATIFVAGTCIFRHKRGIAEGLAALRRAAADYSI